MSRVGFGKGRRSPVAPEGAEGDRRTGAPARPNAEKRAVHSRAASVRTSDHTTMNLSRIAFPLWPTWPEAQLTPAPDDEKHTNRSSPQLTASGTKLQVIHAYRNRRKQDLLYASGRGCQVVDIGNPAGL